MLHGGPSEKLHGERAKEDRDGPVVVQVELHQVREGRRVLGVDHLDAVLAQFEREVLVRRFGVHVWYSGTRCKQDVYDVYYILISFFICSIIVHSALWVVLLTVLLLLLFLF